MTHLKNVVLTRDIVTDLCLFYEKINIVFVAALSTAPLLPEFDDIYRDESPITFLLLTDESNVYFVKIKQGYLIQCYALATYISSKDIISQEQCPRAYEKFLTLSILHRDGFELLRSKLLN